MIVAEKIYTEVIRQTLVWGDWHKAHKQPCGFPILVTYSELEVLLAENYVEDLGVDAYTAYVLKEGVTEDMLEKFLKRKLKYGERTFLEEGE